MNEANYGQEKNINGYRRLKKFKTSEKDQYPIFGIQYNGPEYFDGIIRPAQFSPEFSADCRMLILTTNQIENILPMT